MGHLHLKTKGYEMKRLIVLIHGASNRRQGESDNCKRLMKKIEEDAYDGDEVVNFEWSNYVQSRQDGIFDRRFKNPNDISSFKPLQKIINTIRRETIFGFCMDSIGYEKVVGPTVEPLFTDFLEKKSDGKVEVVIIAWSMGALISYKVLNALYLKRSSIVSRTSLITLGCNIPLNLGESYETLPLRAWDNIYHTYDILGMPLDRIHITDHKYKSMHPFKAHSRYFKDSKCYNLIESLIF